MLRKTLLALAAFALALPAYPAVRLTYQLNGVAVPVSWQSSAFPLRYAVDRRVLSARPGMESIINRALAEWTDVDDANLTVAAAGVVDGAKAGKDGQNSITIADDLFKDQHFLAVTTNWYDDKGHLSEADIQLDGGSFTGPYDMQQLVAHEVGHMLGLDHSAVLSSVMYPYVTEESTDSDDVIAIAELYPKA